MDLDKFDDICRICFSPKSLSSFFEVSYQDMFLNEVFFKCTSIIVTEEDQLPKHICMDCIEKLCNTYNFLTACNESNDTLNAKVGEHNAENNYDDEITVEKDFKVDSYNDSEHESIDSANAAFPLLKPDDYETNVEKSMLATAADGSVREEDFDISALKCSECRKDFVSLYDFVGHYQSTRHRTKRGVCPLCHVSFPSMLQLRKHLLLHSGLYKCNFCDKRFYSLPALRKHLLQYGTNFICEICHIDIKTAWSVQQHIPLHDNQNWCICKKCGKTFSSLKVYFGHMKTHMLLTESTSGVVKKVKCVFCPKKFGTFKSFYAHLKTHALTYSACTSVKLRKKDNSEKLICEVCNKSFGSKYTRKIHMKLHTGDRPYKCFCGAAFAYKNNLFLHEMIHTGEKPNKCEYCGRGFRQKQQLITHIRTHTMEKPYPCPYCGKAFATKGNMTVHSRIHTGETPYSCQVCNKGFKDSNGVKRHKCGYSEKERKKIVQIVKIPYNDDDDDEDHDVKPTIL